MEAYVVHNFESESELSAALGFQFNGRLIYLNPWGFSRQGIVNQTIEATTNSKFGEGDTVLIALKPLFFGRRVNIVVSTLGDLYPSVDIKCVPINR